MVPCTAVLETNFLGLERARLLVLDEADRMMALGFSAQLVRPRYMLTATPSPAF